MSFKKLLSSAVFAGLLFTGMALMTIDEPVQALQWVGRGSLVTKPGRCTKEGNPCSTEGQVLPCGYPQGQTSCAFYSNNCVCMY